MAALKVNHRIMGAIILANHDGAVYRRRSKIINHIGLAIFFCHRKCILYEKNIREA